MAQAWFSSAPRAGLVAASASGGATPRKAAMKAPATAADIPVDLSRRAQMQSAEALAFVGDEKSMSRLLLLDVAGNFEKDSSASYVSGC
jgi:hypothetical protein